MNKLSEREDNTALSDNNLLSFPSVTSARIIFDLAAEQSLLGSILYDTSIFPAVADALAPEAFYEPLHGSIFSAYQRLQSVRARVEVIEIAHEIRSVKPRDGFDPSKYLADLVDKAPSGISAARAAADVVSDLWRRRRLMQLGNELQNAGSAPGDSAELVEKAERALLDIQVNHRSVQLVDAYEAVERVCQQIDGTVIRRGVQLGLQQIDDITGGFMPGELWLGAGRPGMGKSAVANSCALHIARAGLGVIEINCEMTVEQMMRRHIADFCYELYGFEAPSYSKIRKRELTAQHRQMIKTVAAEIRKLQTLKSIYRAGLTVGSLRSLIRRQIACWDRQGISPGLVTVDHVGLIKAASGQQNRAQAQGEIAREMKELAGQLDIPILALVQLNRMVESRDDKRPMLADLRDSGEWEENADGVIGFYREAYYAARDPEPRAYDKKLLWDEKRQSRNVDAIFLKIREGEMQTVKLWADMGRNAIRDRAPEGYYAAKPTPLEALLDPDHPLPPAEVDDNPFG